MERNVITTDQRSAGTTARRVSARGDGCVYIRLTEQAAVEFTPETSSPQSKITANVDSMIDDVLPPNVSKSPEARTTKNGPDSARPSAVLTCGQRLDLDTLGRNRSATGEHHLSAKIGESNGERARQGVPICAGVDRENGLNGLEADVLSRNKRAVECRGRVGAGKEQPLERYGKLVRVVQPPPAPE